MNNLIIGCGLLDRKLNFLKLIQWNWLNCSIRAIIKFEIVYLDDKGLLKI